MLHGLDHGSHLPLGLPLITRQPILPLPKRLTTGIHRPGRPHRMARRQVNSNPSGDFPESTLRTDDDNSDNSSSSTASSSPSMPWANTDNAYTRPSSPSSHAFQSDSDGNGCPGNLHGQIGQTQNELQPNTTLRAETLNQSASTLHPSPVYAEGWGRARPDPTRGKNTRRPGDQADTSFIGGASKSSHTKPLSSTPMPSQRTKYPSSTQHTTPSNTPVPATDRDAPGETTTATSRRILSNPYHSKLGITAPPRMTQVGGTAPLPLSNLGGTSVQTPTLNFKWQKSVLSTPLNKMPIGNSPNWSQSATEVSASINTNHTPFPRTTLDPLKTSIPTIQSLTPIPENSLPAMATPHLNTMPTLPSRPTQTMIMLGQRIRRLPIETLSGEDILTSKSSTGTTVMVAILMEIIITEMLPAADAKTLHNLAHFLMTTAPDTLVLYYKRRQALQHFVDEWSNYPDLLPPFVESDLCPCKTPLAIKDLDLRAKRYSPSLRKREYSDIIMPFVSCFYPANAVRAKKIFQTSYAAKDMGPIARVPGEFRLQWDRHQRDCIFDPPQWVDLRLDSIEDTPQLVDAVDAHHQPTGYSGVVTDDAQECVSFLDGFSPLQHLGESGADDNTPLEDLRRSALQLLPPILSQLTTTTETAEYVVALATTPPESLRSLLTVPGFRAWINKSRGLETDDQRQLIRIRIHIASGTHNWSSRGAVVQFWANISIPMLTELGFSFQIVKAPHDPDSQPADLSTSLDAYTYPKTPQDDRVRTFDVWCVTSCPTWGSPQRSFPPGPQTQQYFDSLASYNISVERRESHPYGIFPCVALSGSDRRDPDLHIYNEYKSRLDLLFDDLPPFQVCWMSLPTSSQRSTMMKCIATSPNDHLVVSQAFQRLFQSTVTTLFPVTAGYQMHFLCTPFDATDAAVLTAVSSQTTFLDTHTRVILTGLCNTNPFDLIAGPPDRDDSSTLATHILSGTIQETTGEEIENPVVKITTDSSYNKYYLYASQEDAGRLIQYGKVLARNLQNWLSFTTPIRVDSSDARKYHICMDTTTPGKHPPLDNDAPTHHTPSVNDSILSLVQDMHRMMQEYGRDIVTLKEDIREIPRSTAPQDDVVSAVQSSITTATTAWRTTLISSNEECVRRITDTIDGFTGTIGDMCSEIGRSHTHTVHTLQDLLDRYDRTSVDTYDSILGYGNEVAMLRLMVEAIVDRINWLIRTHGQQSGHIPPALLDMVTNEAYSDYMAGVDMAHAKDPSRDTSPTSGQPSSSQPLPRDSGLHNTDLPLGGGRPGTGASSFTPTAGWDNNQTFERTPGQTSSENSTGLLSTTQTEGEPLSPSAEAVVARRNDSSPTHPPTSDSSPTPIHLSVTGNQTDQQSPGKWTARDTNTSPTNFSSENDATTELLTQPSSQLGLQPTSSASTSTSSDSGTSTDGSSYSSRTTKSTTTNRRRRTRISRSLSPARTPLKTNVSTSTATSTTTITTSTSTDTITTKKPKQQQQLLQFRPRRGPRHKELSQALPTRSRSRPP